MTVRLGTRTQANSRYGHPEGGSAEQGLTRDIGMSKRVTASITFGSGKLTGANGTFTSTFAVGDPILVQGSNTNDGYFTVTALDGVNAAFLTVDPAPKAEGPLSVTVRTP